MSEFTSFDEITERFNLSANTEFNKQYQELNPMLKSISYKYNSGDIEETFFYVNLLFSSHKKFLGSQTYKRIDKMIEHSIKNEEKETEGIEIPTRKLKRAMQANSISGLNMYTQAIGNIAKEAKNAPFEDSLDLLEAGSLNTFGTCFDNQNLFDTTHAFDGKAGTQSNLQTGSGVTTAQISADLKTAMSTLRGFNFTVDNEDSSIKKKRKLNGKFNPMKFVVICHSNLYSAFNDIRKAGILVVDTTGGSQSNTLMNQFEIIDHLFTDQNDYYVMDMSEPTVKPILISMEDEGSLTLPDDSPSAKNDLRVLRYAHKDLSYGLGYGAWWKIIKVTNT